MALRIFTDEERLLRKKAGNAAYRSKNREKLLAWKAKYRKEHPEKVKAARVIHKARHPERVKAQDSAYRQKNKDKIKTTQTAYREANREKLRAAAMVRYEMLKEICPEKLRAQSTSWQKANPGKVNASTARRYANRVRATPAWADRERIKKIYIEASQRGLHVDHIVPIRSPIVCGLHVESNLQLLTREANMLKGNRQWPGMP